MSGEYTHGSKRVKLGFEHQLLLHKNELPWRPNQFTRLSPSPSSTKLATPVYIRWGLENPDEYRLAFMLRDPTSSAHPDSMGDPSEKSFEGVKVFAGLEKQILAGVAAGELNSIEKDPRAIAQCVWASLHGLVSVLIAFPIFDWVAKDRLIAAHTRLLLDGLRPPAPASPRKIKKPGKVRHGG